MRRRILAAALALSALASARTERFGLFAGHNLGFGREPLMFAERDAERVAGIFAELGGIPRESLHVLKSPDVAGLEAAFADLEAKARAKGDSVDAVFLFYFSGHGDDRSLILGNQQLDLAGLRKRLDGFPAKLRVGLFDACQSGAITRIKGAKVIAPLTLQKGVNGEGSIFITSSGGDENSQEADHLEASFFTHHLASGLRGAADVSGDRVVTVTEAYNYAFNHTVAETGGTRGGTQHPNARFRLDVEGDVALTDLAAKAAGLRIEKGTQGEYLILDAHGAVMAEVNKEPRAEILVALNPGRYQVFKRVAGKVRGTELELVHGAPRTLSEKTMATLPRQDGKLKGWARGGRPGEEPPEHEREGVRMGRIAPMAGVSFQQGPLVMAGGSLALGGPTRLLAQYSIHSRRGWMAHHRALAGLEYLHGLHSIHLVGRGLFSVGRKDDDHAHQRVDVRFHCGDLDSPDEGSLECTVGNYRGHAIYRTIVEGFLETGVRFFPSRRLGLYLGAGLAYPFYQSGGERLAPEFLDRFMSKPAILEAQTWF